MGGKLKGCLKWVGIGIIALIILGVIGSMIGQDDSEPEQQQAAVSETDTETQGEDSTSSEPAEPEPTAIPPTATPEPTAIPEPTPEPIVIEGEGDDIVDVEIGEGNWVLHVTGNASGQFFKVESFDDEGENRLHVNTTEADYEGIVPMRWGSANPAVRFGVESVDSWTIRVLPVTAVRTLDVPGSIEGNGDEVIQLSAIADLITMKGNEAGVYFGVKGYALGSRGRLFFSNNSVLANTTDVYEGQDVAGDAEFLVIEAVGDWSIEVTSK